MDAWTLTIILYFRMPEQRYIDLGTFATQGECIKRALGDHEHPGEVVKQRQKYNVPFNVPVAAKCEPSKGA